jgi:hypothetical protein
MRNTFDGVRMVSLGRVAVIVLVAVALSGLAVLLSAVAARGRPGLSIALGLAIGVPIGLGSVVTGLNTFVPADGYVLGWMPELQDAFVACVVVVLWVLVASFAASAAFNRPEAQSRHRMARPVDADAEVFDSEWP